jgi:hypothetical protein
MHPLPFDEDNLSKSPPPPKTPISNSSKTQAPLLRPHTLPPTTFGAGGWDWPPLGSQLVAATSGCMGWVHVAANPSLQPQRPWGGGRATRDRLLDLSPRPSERSLVVRLYKRGRGFFPVPPFLRSTLPHLWARPPNFPHSVYFTSHPAQR